MNINILYFKFLYFNYILNHLNIQYISNSKIQVLLIDSEINFLLHNYFMFRFIFIFILHLSIFLIYPFSISRLKILSYIELNISYNSVSFAM